ncbi:hypothetical protein [Reinekea thalattae]|uniref:PEGA domain-containing protein n=1 Tax=Reinekea thalattae TaxID=2593301 RepID=A0A5C8ZBU7_9GAMM|nr:hypothetical protein [Reinekea thalattae]TXR54376.1 hypothetical protein FME95_07515 [Reinekea thalattae]
MRYAIVLFFTITLSACSINGPVTQQATIDDRPTVTFDVGGYNPVKLMLYVDGFSYGALAKYQYKRTELKLLPGKHLVEVYHNDQLIYSRRQYFGESTASVIKVYQ